jgi:hypothetical protein
VCKSHQNEHMFMLATRMFFDEQLQEAAANLLGMQIRNSLHAWSKQTAVTFKAESHGCHDHRNGSHVLGVFTHACTILLQSAQRNCRGVTFERFKVPEKTTIFVFQTMSLINAKIFPCMRCKIPARAPPCDQYAVLCHVYGAQFDKT